jgi:hypothetical protein
MFLPQIDLPRMIDPVNTPKEFRRCTEIAVLDQQVQTGFAHLRLTSMVTVLGQRLNLAERRLDQNKASLVKRKYLGHLNFPMLDGTYV